MIQQIANQNYDFGEDPMQVQSGLGPRVYFKEPVRLSFVCRTIMQPGRLDVPAGCLVDVVRVVCMREIDHPVFQKRLEFREAGTSLPNLPTVALEEPILFVRPESTLRFKADIETRSAEDLSGYISDILNLTNAIVETCGEAKQPGSGHVSIRNKGSYGFIPVTLDGCPLGIPDGFDHEDHKPKLSGSIRAQSGDMSFRFG